MRVRTTKPIERSGDRDLQVGTQPGGRRHPIDCEAHTFCVRFRRSRKVSDVAVQVFAGERANSQSCILLMVRSHSGHA